MSGQLCRWLSTGEMPLAAGVAGTADFDSNFAASFFPLSQWVRNSAPVGEPLLPQLRKGGPDGVRKRVSRARTYRAALTGDTGVANWGGRLWRAELRRERWRAMSPDGPDQSRILSDVSVRSRRRG